MTRCKVYYHANSKKRISLESWMTLTSNTDGNQSVNQIKTIFNGYKNTRLAMKWISISYSTFRETSRKNMNKNSLCILLS